MYFFKLCVCRKREKGQPSSKPQWEGGRGGGGGKGGGGGRGGVARGVVREPSVRYTSDPQMQHYFPRAADTSHQSPVFR